MREEDEPQTEQQAHPTTFRGRGRGRGRASWYPPSSSRGRGAAPFHRNATWVAPGRPGASSTPAQVQLPVPGMFKNKVLVLNGTGSGNTSTREEEGSELEEGEMRRERDADDSATTPPIPSTSTASTTPVVPINPIPVGGYKNRTLILNGMNEEDYKKIDHFAVLPPPRSGRKGKQREEKKDGEEGKEKSKVVIDGITFLQDPRGHKLVRSTDPSDSEATATSTDQSNISKSTTSHLGQSYIRTKSGNLVSREFARKRAESKEKGRKMRLDRMVGIGGEGQPSPKGRRGKRSTKLCRYFQKTGQCTKALTCRYTHDSTRVAICPSFLRSSCPLTSSTCLLSHSPNAHRSPHCLHFPSCRLPSSQCPYSHVHVDPRAGVCEDFVRLGWCEKGMECKERHCWECKEFSEKGVCRKKGCRLPHVLRRRNKGDEEEEEKEECGMKADYPTMAMTGSKRKREDREGISGEQGRKLKQKKLMEDALRANPEVEEGSFVAFSASEDEVDSDSEESETESSSEEESPSESGSEDDEEVANALKAPQAPKVAMMSYEEEEDLSDSEMRRRRREEED